MTTGSLIVNLSADVGAWLQQFSNALRRFDLIQMRSRRRGLPLLRVSM